MGNKNEEIEFVYTNIDVKEIKNKLESKGAEFIFDRKFENVIFDYPDFRLNEKGGWIRLRKDGNEISLAYKERQGITKKEDTGMIEIEFGISSVEKAVDFFKAIGLIIKFHQEKRRIRYMLDDVEFDIDFWPKIPPYLEVEGKSEEEINRVLEKVNLDPSKKRRVNNFVIYKENNIDLMEYKILTFDKEEKRKKENK